MRLVEACWAEISQVRLSDVSINRIIAAAHIPRGSFYQYFEDKEDLIRYLLEDIRTYFMDQMRDILVEAEGDLFAFPLVAYDRFVAQQGIPPTMLSLFVEVLKRNKGIDIQSFLGGGEPCLLLPDQLWEVVDAKKLRQSDRAYADHVFRLTCAVLAFAVAEALGEPSRLDSLREAVKIRTEILRCGGAAEGHKEEPT